MDTIILVLRKKPLIFLHVYHHIITMVLVYVMLDTEVAVVWLPMVANCAVHVPMYYYYGIMSLGKTVWWKKYITFMQIIQFVFDLLGNSFAFYYYFNGIKCSHPIPALLFGQFILLSFLVLFLNFWSKTYTPKPSRGSKERHTPSSATLRSNGSSSPKMKPRKEQ